MKYYFVPSKFNSWLLFERKNMSNKTKNNLQMLRVEDQTQSLSTILPAQWTQVMV